jgi:hypothetical protein
MSGSSNFERAWQAKFARCLREIVGEDMRQKIMEGAETLSPESHPKAVIDWTRQAMERLETLVDEDKQRQVMVGCACHHPKSSLQAARKAYEETGDIGLVHRMLQQQFESFLRDSLDFKDEMVKDITNRGWGLAGILQGNTIIATKIPKSGNLVAYMKETDPAKKRQLYCHCPRIREALKTSQTIPTIYCYCGAGFYKGIWEEILRKPVEVEVLESVLRGDQVCKIAVHLPG